MTASTEDLASRVRAARTAHGWSLSELAAASGVSKAMISRIERGESSPTASLLGKLSGALEVTMSQLLAPASSTWTDPGTGYRRRAVTTADDFGFDVTEVVLPPGTAQTFPASAYSFNRHLIWVADGELAFTEGELRHVLGSGDSLRLGLPAECTFANETSSPCRYLVMVAPSP